MYRVSHREHIYSVCKNVILLNWMFCGTSFDQTAKALQPQRYRGLARVGNNVQGGDMTETHKLFGMKNANELLQDLAAHLAWNAGAGLVYEASRAHLVWASARLRIWDSFTGGDLYRRVKLLPGAVQQRLMLAPQLFFLLQGTATPSATDYAAVCSYVEVEEILAGVRESVDGIAWSALGDVCLAPDVDTGFRKCYEAPRAGHAVIDPQSQHAAKEMIEQWGRLRNDSPEESSHSQRRLVESLHYIGQISPTALATIESSIRVISTVSTADNPQLTRAGSMRSAIGRMFITNAYSDVWTFENLADTIVHEAIHSLIYKLELVTPFHTDYSAALTARAKSPWSGRLLPLRSFVHACFVWYGLYRFWSLNQTTASNPYCLQSRNGFLPQCPLDALSKQERDLIQPYVCSTIELLFLEVNSQSTCEAKKDAALSSK